jgi:hypothetical protein
MSSVPRTVIASPTTSTSSAQRGNLSVRSRTSARIRRTEHHAIEIRVGEHHDAESDDREQRNQPMTSFADCHGLRGGSA